ncbi:MAG: glycosyltransferase [Ramlibacter sp.]|nr:glycosyltransferase [Ramlibacter sp.]
MTISLTVVLCTYRPNLKRLSRTLSALKSQSLAPSKWELVLVDNGSSPPINVADVELYAPSNTRILVEPRPGLTAARRCGFANCRGQVIVLVDDDNVLEPEYLERVIHLFEAHPQLGVVGGKVLPEFEREPEPWMREFDSLLACRDYGPEPLVAVAAQNGSEISYPAFAPIGAGMAMRACALKQWLREPASSLLTDRKGSDLTSGGDNDIIFSISLSGWSVGYFPQLSLTHLIAAERTTAAYLARLNQGIQKSWIQVLRKYDASPWPTIAGWTVPIRKAKAWLSYRPWSTAAADVRWRGACGHFEGRAR